MLPAEMETSFHFGPSFLVEVVCDLFRKIFFNAIKILSSRWQYETSTDNATTDVARILINHEEAIYKVQWFFGWAIKELIDVSQVKLNKSQQESTTIEHFTEAKNCLALAKKENTPP